MFVERLTYGNAIKQIYIPDNGYTIFYRYIYASSTWSNWQQIYPDYTNINLGSNGYIIFNNGLIIQWSGDTVNNDISLGTDYDIMVPTFFPIFFTAGQPTIIPIIQNGYEGTDVTPITIAVNNPVSNPSNYWILWRKQFYFRQKASSIIGTRAFKYIAIGY